MLSRYPTGIVCTHDAGSQGSDPDRVCFCAYGFPPDMDAESTGQMNGIISAYNRRCGLDMPLLWPPAIS